MNRLEMTSRLKCEIASIHNRLKITMNQKCTTKIVDNLKKIFPAIAFTKVLGSLLAFLENNFERNNQKSSNGLHFLRLKLN